MKHRPRCQAESAHSVSGESHWSKFSGSRKILSLDGHQPFVGAIQCQLNPERRGEQKIDLSGFNLLQVARGDFGALGQLILRPASAHPFPAHVRAKDLDSLPFFTGNGHDILNRFSRS